MENHCICNRNAHRGTNRPASPACWCLCGQPQRKFITFSIEMPTGAPASHRCWPVGATVGAIFIPACCSRGDQRGRAQKSFLTPKGCSTTTSPHQEQLRQPVSNAHTGSGCLHTKVANHQNKHKPAAPPNSNYDKQPLTTAAPTQLQHSRTRNNSLFQRGRGPCTYIAIFCSSVLPPPPKWERNSEQKWYCTMCARVWSHAHVRV